MKDVRLVIEYLSPDVLTPYENNARIHEDFDLAAIKKSITDTGFNDPIGIWGENNLIVEGHGRRLAAIDLGMDKVPCIRLDHMTEEERREYALAHNKTAELSRWDFGKLEEELASLTIDMSGFGFANSTESIEDIELDDDSEPEEKTVVRLVFQDYKAYKPHENEIKEFAEKIGAIVTVGK